MPDLEQLISKWRTQMLAAGIKSPVPLDELESHLRDDIAKHVKTGLSEEAAFEVSVRHLGSAGSLRVEFGKANKVKGVQIMLRIITTIAGLFGMVLGLGVILPALGRSHQHPELWNGQLQGLVMFGVAAVIVGSSATLYCIRTRRGARGRILVAIGLLLASAFYSIAAITALFHASEMTAAAWMIWVAALAASVAYFGSCFRANWRQPQRA